MELLKFLNGYSPARTTFYVMAMLIAMFIVCSFVESVVEKLKSK